MKREHSQKCSEGIHLRCFKTCSVAAVAAISVICLALLLGRTIAADVAGVPAAGLGNTICDPGKGGPCGTAPIGFVCWLQPSGTPEGYTVYNCVGSPVKDVIGPYTNDALTNGVGNITLCPSGPCLSWTKGTCHLTGPPWDCETTWSNTSTNSGSVMCCSSSPCS
jgi:hypothetical protein